ncbi:hypothetical protein [Gracilinema caldarium]|uniref:Uncharacterized protein n=1 Tax=Gracilinema caldarium (strain ATCC 51460 / DSM 7334 / H1) TaxID=744872 RepID=F8F3H0_GRAC1|nr:hypothetical protein [Gracilinema caldarium]AEJ19546.1 hypothetical protein Spica_1400 [Gracilinema caldarium DSM 7334]
MKFRRVVPKALFGLLLKRFIVLLSIMNFVLILLYGIGNYQGFLADTQLFLLSLLVHGTILLSLSSMVGCLYSALTKRTGLAVYLGYGGIAILSGLLSFIIAFLIQITQGTV